LKDFPVDYVKIDRSFVDQMETSKPDRDLVATIVSLARNFGLATIAEGVETPAQAERLTALGAEFAQGYLFGRPMPAAAFEEWLASRG
ncbi:MAG: EAL domain-containing protein, partial [Actinomycetes bacterium]